MEAIPWRFESSPGHKIKELDAIAFGDFYFVAQEMTRRSEAVYKTSKARACRRDGVASPSSVLEFEYF